MAYEELSSGLRKTTQESPGVSAPEDRASAAKIARAIHLGQPTQAGSLSPEEHELIETLVRDPVAMDPRALVQAGTSQDRLFELVLAAAVESGLTHLDLGRAALEKATRE